jgi:hypothetical protein
VDAFVTEFSQSPDGHVVFSPPGPSSAASWVAAHPTSFDLLPGELRRVNVRISVPADAEPGDHQVGIVFEVPAEQGAGNVSISGAVGAEMLIQVPGTVIRHIEFGPLQAPTIADGGPIMFELTVRNLGTVHRDFIRPQDLFAMMNGERVPFPDFTVLRDATRQVRTAWIDPPLICFCHVRVTADDGQGATISAEARVIVFPVRFVVGVLFAGIGLLLVTRGWRHRVRTSRHRIGRAAHEEAMRDVEEGRDRP